MYGLYTALSLPDIISAWRRFSNPGYIGESGCKMQSENSASVSGNSLYALAYQVESFDYTVIRRRTTIYPDAQKHDNFVRNAPVLTEYCRLKALLQRLCGLLSLIGCRAWKWPQIAWILTKFENKMRECAKTIASGFVRITQMKTHEKKMAVTA